VHVPFLDHDHAHGSALGHSWSRSVYSVCYKLMKPDPCLASMEASSANDEFKHGQTIFYHLLLIRHHLPCPDWDGVRNFVSAMPKTIERLVLVSSIGVTKYNEIPWRYSL
jgi:hypothetical protein